MHNNIVKYTQYLALKAHEMKQNVQSNIMNFMHLECEGTK